MQTKPTPPLTRSNDKSLAKTIGAQTVQKTLQTPLTMATVNGRSLGGHQYVDIYI